MPSLIPGYEYDIFISYRQNDNRSGASAGSGQGWVTEFMKALQEELAATIKEPVSVYFDANPHDGLLETHNVDKSLEGKLKCLIFIPILSQTYCDPKSFAWQHEFCVFNGMAKEDKFGRDVKLSSGNVTSRILPIRIHDLDAEDKTIIENEIGGVLRAIEFIYKTPGVNRPLTLSDKKEDNANKTFYKDQLNKAANAIKEIIAALKNPAVQSTLINTNQQQLTKTTQSKTKFILAGIALLIAAALYFLYPKFISKTSPEEAIDKSVAVLPFADMSPNHDQEYFGDGVAEEIINVLAQAKDLKVISRSSSFQFKGKNEDLRKIGDQLGVATVLEGSVRKSNGTIRVTAQLIKVVDGTHLWSKTFDSTGDDALAIQDEIAKAVAKEFQTTLSIENAPKSRPWNEEAYRLYQKGRYLFDRVGYGEREKAHELFLQAAQKDSSQAILWAYLGSGFIDRGDSISYMKSFESAIKLDSTLSETYAGRSRYERVIKLNYRKAHEYAEKALRLGEKSALSLRVVGLTLAYNRRQDEAIVQIKKAIAIDPLQMNNYNNLGFAYEYSGNTGKAVATYQQLLELNQNFAGGHTWLSEALRLDGKLKEALEENSKEPDEELKLGYRIPILYDMGKAEDAKRALNDFVKKYGNNVQSQFLIGSLYAHMNQHDECFRWMEKALTLRDNSLERFLVEPLLNPVRKDPRYAAFKKKLNFPE